MSGVATLSTIVDSQVKKAASEFCKRRGLKLRYLVEQALIEQLEDEMDIETYRKRRHEKRVPMESILDGRKSKK